MIEFHHCRVIPSDVDVKNYGIFDNLIECGRGVSQALGTLVP